MKRMQGMMSKGWLQASAMLLMAGCLLNSQPVCAKTYTWVGPSGNSWYDGNGNPRSWDSTTWPWYPSSAGDVANFFTNVSSACLIIVNNYGNPNCFGSLVSSNAGAASLYVCCYYQSTNTLFLNNSAAPVVIQNLRGTLTFSEQWVAQSLLVLRLTGGSLVVTNGGGANTTVTMMGANCIESVLYGGTVASPKKVTVAAGGTGALTFKAFGNNTGPGTNTYVGTWTVDGSNSTLALNDNRNLGTNSINSVTLTNGGTLDVSAVTGGWVLSNRLLKGTGTINATNKLLTIDNGGVLAVGETNSVGALTIIASSNLVFNPGSKIMVNLADETSADLVTANLRTGTTLTLGGTLDVTTIGGYKPQTTAKWVILQTVGGTIQGSFAQVNLPGGAYRLAVTSTNLTVTYGVGTCMLFR